MKSNTFVLIGNLNHQLHENNLSLLVDFTADSSVLNVMPHEHFIRLRYFLMVGMNIMTQVVMKIRY